MKRQWVCVNIGLAFWIKRVPHSHIDAYWQANWGTLTTKTRQTIHPQNTVAQISPKPPEDSHPPPFCGFYRARTGNHLFWGRILCRGSTPLSQSKRPAANRPQAPQPRTIFSYCRSIGALILQTKPTGGCRFCLDVGQFFVHEQFTYFSLEKSHTWTGNASSSSGI